MTDKLLSIDERQKVHIVNPCAGDGKYLESIRRKAKENGDELIMTEAIGGAETLCREIAAANPMAHLMIYGGDGTVHEAVNGIMTSGSADTVSFFRFIVRAFIRGGQLRKEAPRASFPSMLILFLI